MKHILYFIGKTRVPGTQNYAITYDKYEDFTAPATLNINTNSGKVQVKKIDAENSKPIKGVTFQLLKLDGTQVATAITDDNGIATFSNLYQGNYKLREIVTGNNYILNSEVFDITVEYNKITSKTVANYPKKGNLKINKTDSETHEPIQGVTFQLLDLNGNIVANGTTDINGELTFPNLRVGKYKLKETSTNVNYVLNTIIFDVDIEYNKTTIKNITNNYKKGNIKINKTDSETSQGIEGITFQLLDLKGNIVQTVTTNSNGEAYFNNLRIGNYRLKEIKTKPNYILNTAIFDVEVEYNKTTIQNVVNDYKKGNLIVHKVDKDNHKIPLGNLIFDLFSNEFQRVIKTYTTDVNGEFTINNLRIGEYRLIERNTGKWYELAEDTTVNIAWNETIETLIENELKKGQIRVIKVDKDNNKIRIPGVKFEILNENDEVLEVVVTNEDGEALTKKYAIRDYEKLKIREIETNEFYILNNEVKTIKLKENQVQDVIFTNELKKGKIKVIKVDEENNEIKLQGVEFKIYDKNNNIVDTIITDKNGEAISKELKVGQYYKIQETKTLEGYSLNKTCKTIKLTQNNIENVIFTNKKIKITVKKKLPKTGF